MTARGVVIDAVTGAIKRKIVADPEQFSVQVGAGETMFALVDDDGAFIDDENLVVSEAGDWALRDDAPEDVAMPGAELGLVVA